jgi:hypothetical protein
MKTALDILGLNVQLMTVAAFIWNVFEIRLLRHLFENHMNIYHGQGRRASDGKDNQPPV